MILDVYSEFADKEAVAGAAGTFNVGDVVDLQTARDIGNGRPVYLAISVDVAPTGADTVKFQLVSDSITTPDTAGTQSIHITTGDIPIASLPVGTRFIFALPQDNAVSYERYLGFQEVNVGAVALADLQVTAGLTLDPAGWKAYPDGNN